MEEKEAENVDAILVHSDCGISSGILELSENWSAERPGEDAFRDIWTGLTLVGSVVEEGMLEVSQKRQRTEESDLRVWVHT